MTERSLYSQVKKRDANANVTANAAMASTGFQMNHNQISKDRNYTPQSTSNFGGFNHNNNDQILNQNSHKHQNLLDNADNPFFQIDVRNLDQFHNQAQSQSIQKEPLKIPSINPNRNHYESKKSQRSKSGQRSSKNSISQPQNSQMNPSNNLLIQGNNPQLIKPHQQSDAAKIILNEYLNQHSELLQSINNTNNLQKLSHYIRDGVKSSIGYHGNRRDENNTSSRLNYTNDLQTSQNFNNLTMNNPNKNAQDSNQNNGNNPNRRTPYQLSDAQIQDQQNNNQFYLSKKYVNSGSFFTRKNQTTNNYLQPNDQNSIPQIPLRRGDSGLTSDDMSAQQNLIGLSQTVGVPVKNNLKNVNGNNTNLQQNKSVKIRSFTPNLRQYKTGGGGQVNSSLTHRGNLGSIEKGREDNEQKVYPNFRSNTNSRENLSSSKYKFKQISSANKVITNNSQQFMPLNSQPNQQHLTTDALSTQEAVFKTENDIYTQPQMDKYQYYFMNTNPDQIPTNSKSKKNNSGQNFNNGATNSAAKLNDEKNNSSQSSLNNNQNNLPNKNVSSPTSNSNGNLNSRPKSKQSGQRNQLKQKQEEKMEQIKQIYLKNDKRSKSSGRGSKLNEIPEQGYHYMTDSQKSIPRQRNNNPFYVQQISHQFEEFGDEVEEVDVTEMFKKQSKLQQMDYNHNLQFQQNKPEKNNSAHKQNKRYQNKDLEDSDLEGANNKLRQSHLPIKGSQQTSSNTQNDALGTTGASVTGYSLSNIINNEDNGEKQKTIRLDDINDSFHNEVNPKRINNSSLSEKTQNSQNKNTSSIYAKVIQKITQNNGSQLQNSSRLQGTTNSNSNDQKQNPNQTNSSALNNSQSGFRRSTSSFTKQKIGNENNEGSNQKNSMSLSQNQQKSNQNIQQEGVSGSFSANPSVQNLNNYNNESNFQNQTNSNLQQRSSSKTQIRKKTISQTGSSKKSQSSFEQYPEKNLKKENENNTNQNQNQPNQKDSIQQKLENQDKSESKKDKQLKENINQNANLDNQQKQNQQHQSNKIDKNSNKNDSSSQENQNSNNNNNDQVNQSCKKKYKKESFSDNQNSSKPPLITSTNQINGQQKNNNEIADQNNQSKIKEQKQLNNQSKQNSEDDQINQKIDDRIALSQIKQDKSIEIDSDMAGKNKSSDSQQQSSIDEKQLGLKQKDQQPSQNQNKIKNNNSIADKESHLSKNNEENSQKVISNEDTNSQQKKVDNESNGHVKKDSEISNKSTKENGVKSQILQTQQDILNNKLHSQKQIKQNSSDQIKQQQQDSTSISNQQLKNDQQEKSFQEKKDELNKSNQKVENDQMIHSKNSKSNNQQNQQSLPNQSQKDANETESFNKNSSKKEKEKDNSIHNGQSADQLNQTQVSQNKSSKANQKNVNKKDESDQSNNNKEINNSQNKSNNQKNDSNNTQKEINQIGSINKSQSKKDLKNENSINNSKIIDQQNQSLISNNKSSKTNQNINQSKQSVDQSLNQKDKDESSQQQKQSQLIKSDQNNSQDTSKISKSQKEYLNNENNSESLIKNSSESKINQEDKQNLNQSNHNLQEQKDNKDKQQDGKGQQSQDKINIDQNYKIINETNGRTDGVVIREIREQNGNELRIITEARIIIQNENKDTISGGKKQKKRNKKENSFEEEEESDEQVDNNNSYENQKKSKKNQKNSKNDKISKDKNNQEVLESEVDSDDECESYEYGKAQQKNRNKKSKMVDGEDKQFLEDQVNLINHQTKGQGKGNQEKRNSSTNQRIKEDISYAQNTQSDQKSSKAVQSGMNTPNRNNTDISNFIKAQDTSHILLNEEIQKDPQNYTYDESINDQNSILAQLKSNQGSLKNLNPLSNLNNQQDQQHPDNSLNLNYQEELLNEINTEDKSKENQLVNQHTGQIQPLEQQNNKIDANKKQDNSQNNVIASPSQNKKSVNKYKEILNKNLVQVQRYPIKETEGEESLQVAHDDTSDEIDQIVKVKILHDQQTKNSHSSYESLKQIRKKGELTNSELDEIERNKLNSLTPEELLDLRIQQNKRRLRKINRRPHIIKQDIEKLIENGIIFDIKCRLPKNIDFIEEIKTDPRHGELAFGRESYLLDSAPKIRSFRGYDQEMMRPCAMMQYLIDQYCDPQIVKEWHLMQHFQYNAQIEENRFLNLQMNTQKNSSSLTESNVSKKNYHYGSKAEVSTSLNIFLNPTLLLMDSPLVYEYRHFEYNFFLEVEDFYPIEQILLNRFKDRKIYEENELIFIFTSLIECVLGFRAKNICLGNIQIEHVAFCPTSNSYKFFNLTKAQVYEEQNQEKKYNIYYSKIYQPPEIADIEGIKENGQVFNIFAADLYALGVTLLCFKYHLISNNRTHNFIQNRIEMCKNSMQLSGIIINYLLESDPKQRLLNMKTIQKDLHDYLKKNFQANQKISQKEKQQSPAPPCSPRQSLKEEENLLDVKPGVKLNPDEFKNEKLMAVNAPQKKQKDSEEEESDDDNLEEIQKNSNLICNAWNTSNNKYFMQRNNAPDYELEVYWNEGKSINNQKLNPPSIKKIAKQIHDRIQSAQDIAKMYKYTFQWEKASNQFINNLEIMKQQNNKVSDSEILRTVNQIWQSLYYNNELEDSLHYNEVYFNNIHTLFIHDEVQMAYDHLLSGKLKWILNHKVDSSQDFDIALMCTEQYPLDKAKVLILLGDFFAEDSEISAEQYYKDALEIVQSIILNQKDAMKSSATNNIMKESSATMQTTEGDQDFDDLFEREEYVIMKLKERTQHQLAIIEDIQMSELREKLVFLEENQQKLSSLEKAKIQLDVANQYCHQFLKYNEADFYYQEALNNLQTKQQNKQSSEGIRTSSSQKMGTSSSREKRMRKSGQLSEIKETQQQQLKSNTSSSSSTASMNVQNTKDLEYDIQKFRIVNFLKMNNDEEANIMIQKIVTDNTPENGIKNIDNILQLAIILEENLFQEYCLELYNRCYALATVQLGAKNEFTLKLKDKINKL